MALFNFLKTKKEGMTETTFIGRYQSILKIRQILGEDVPAMEMQIAINKDFGERNEILGRLEKLEGYIHSDHFTNQFDVYSAGKEIGEIIGEGYKTCVLQNDIELENRCLVIHQDIIDYTKKQFEKDGVLTETKIADLDKILNLHTAAGFLTWMTLGDKLKTSDEQHAWMIISSLVHPNKRTGGIKDLIAWAVLTDKDHDVNKIVEPFRKMKKKLLENKKISDAEGIKIDELIEQGLAKNKSAGK